MPSMEEADKAQAEHDQRITNNRARLWGSLARAEANLNDALTAHRELSVGDAWDVEYEGQRTELGDHLAEVRRLLIITRAMLPTGADATTDVDRDVKELLHALKAGSYLT